MVITGSFDLKINPTRTVLHLCCNDKFIYDFIKLVKNHQNINVWQEHKFIVYGRNSFSPKYNDDNVIYFDNTLFQKLNFIFVLVVNFFKYGDFYFHGLFNKNLELIFALLPKSSRRYSWVLWGGDLYNARRMNMFEKWLTLRFRKSIDRIITTIKYDAELANKMYQSNASYSRNFMYPSHYARKKLHKENHDTLKIQIGNSADPSNNHEEVLTRVAADIGNKKVEIYCPLSYGGQTYSKKIVAIGDRLFGPKFTPMLKFMQSKDYDVYLNTIDIAIFNHERQQALGNIIALLSLGALVILNARSPVYPYLKSLGFHVKTLEMEISKSQADSLLLSKNIRLAREYFNEQALVTMWSECFAH